MKKLVSSIVIGGLAVVAVAIGAGAQRESASAVSCSDPASYSWKGTLPSYGIRDYAVTFCGDAGMEAYAGVTWKGSKNISLALVGPDGTEHVFAGRSPLGGELSGPLDSGTWTLVVRNGSPSNASFKASLDFQ